MIIRTSARLLGFVLLASALGGGSAVAATSATRSAPAQTFSASPLATSVDTSDRAAVAKVLLNSDVYLAFVPDADDSANGKVNVSAMGVRLEDGQTAIAVFTSQYKLIEAFGTEVAAAPMKGRDLLALYGDGVIVVDFGVAGETRLRPADTAAILSASAGS